MPSGEYKGKIRFFAAAKCTILSQGFQPLDKDAAGAILPDQPVMRSTKAPPLDWSHHDLYGPFVGTKLLPKSLCAPLDKYEVAPNCALVIIEPVHAGSGKGKTLIKWIRKAQIKIKSFFTTPVSDRIKVNPLMGRDPMSNKTKQNKNYPHDPLTVEKMHQVLYVSIDQHSAAMTRARTHHNALCCS